LDDALFERDALIWRGPASRAVDYCGPAGARLRVEFPDAHDLGVWTKPGAHFVCIEPWWGRADPAGLQGALFEKPGMLMLEPGDRRQFEMRLIPCAAVMQNE
jgi:galactose mutarotase-like enzyme